MRATGLIEVHRNPHPPICRYQDVPGTLTLSDRFVSGATGGGYAVGGRASP